MLHVLEQEQEIEYYGSVWLQEPEYYGSVWLQVLEQEIEYFFYETNRFCHGYLKTVAEEKWRNLPRLLKKP